MATPAPGDEPDSPVSGSGAAVDALRDTWSRYVSDWREDASLNRGVATLGEEWGNTALTDKLIELASPHLGPSVDVLELGCGGGKFSLRLAPRSRSLLCTDISTEMIEQTRATLAARGVAGEVSYRVLNGIDFDGVPSNSVDFVFSYDVLLHLQPQNVFSYLLDARRILRAGGVFMLHQINLASVGGMDHFITQFLHGTWKRELGDPLRRGHVFYMSEDQLRAIAAEAGFAVGRLIGEFPEAGTELWQATQGRDLIAFLHTGPCNRLGDVPLSAISLVQVEGEETVHAVWEGRRAAIRSAYYFEDAGFDWQRVARIDRERLAALPETPPLEPWEWPRA